MSIPHRINALGDLKLRSATGLIHHDSEVSHNHANDSFLSDLKGLKGILTNGDLIQFNGSQLVAKQASDFANASDLADYLQEADQVVKSVASGVLSVSGGGELNIDLSSYALSGDLSGKLDSSDQVVKSVDVTGALNLNGSGELSVDLSSYALSTDLANKLDTTSQYIQSVSAPLSVSGGNELSIDLSSYLQSADLSDYLETSNLGTSFTALSTAEVGSDSTFKHNSKRERVKLSAYSGSFTESLSISGDDDKCYSVKATVVYRNTDSTAHGKVKYEAVWKRASGTMSVVAGSDSQSHSGDCTGTEFQAINQSGNVSLQVKGSNTGGVGSTGFSVVAAKWVEC